MKLVKLLFALFIGATLVTSCSSDDSQENEIDKTQITVDNISGKWLTNNAEGLQSIEFNESMSYILVELDGFLDTESYFGTYSINNNSEIVLGDLGVLSSIDLSENTLDFVYETSDGDIASFKTNGVVETISSSLKSEWLSKTWNLISVDDELVEGTDDALHVLFSQVGTYYVDFINDNYDFNSQWMWQNDTEQVICYSHSGSPDCIADENEVIIVEVTDTKLVMSEDDVIFVMEPL